MATQTFTAGFLRTRQMRLWLAQMSLPYTEIKGTFESAFVVSMWTAQHRIGVQQIRLAIIAEKRQEEWDKFTEHRKEIKRLNKKRLRKMNFWRKATFRKPLKRLPPELMAY